MKAKYLNPFTDFGFKKLFGEEVSKHLLIDFLNELMPEKHHIQDLFYRKTEQLGTTTLDRKAIFDLYCENTRGDKFIVELQKAKQNFFKDRTLFYSTFPIREQAEKGEWDYQLQPVYCVGILDFIFEEHPEDRYIQRVQLKNEACEVFYDKLTFVFIEMPKFRKSEAELSSHFDKWLYFLKNLEDFEEIPASLREEIFEQAFSVAEIAKFNPAQLEAYEQSLKYYRDLKNVIDTAAMEARALGREEGITEGLTKGRIEGREEGMLEGLDKGKMMGKSEEKIT